jgi:hypothetical protein
MIGMDPCATLLRRFKLKFPRIAGQAPSWTAQPCSVKRPWILNVWPWLVPIHLIMVLTDRETRNPFSASSKQEANDDHEYRGGL